MTVLGILVYLLLANDAFGCPIRSPSVLLGEELVLVDFATTAFGSVAGSFLPLVRHYHLRKLLLTLVAHHSSSSGFPLFQLQSPK